MEELSAMGLIGLFSGDASAMAELLGVSVPSMGIRILMTVLAAVIAYFCGCFNGAVIVSKYILHNDVRKHGSGNAGLTNFHRVFGGPLTFVVILTDVLKAVVGIQVAVWIAGYIAPFQPLVAVQFRYLAGVFCLLGHMFPCMFNFKGGKGVLSCGTIALMIDWRVALVVWGGFVVLFLLTKWVSLGSCWAGLTFPIVSFFVYHDVLITILAIICGGLLLWGHRGNIKRLLNGTESKFSLHRKKEAES